MAFHWQLHECLAPLVTETRTNKALTATRAAKHPLRTGFLRPIIRWPGAVFCWRNKQYLTHDDVKQFETGEWISHRIHVCYIYIYMVTFTINIPPMLAYIPYMDPMGIDLNILWILLCRMRAVDGSLQKAGTAINWSCFAWVAVALPHTCFIYSIS